MKEVEGYLASIVESSADAIMSIDLNGILTSWNKGAEDIFGYRAKEIVGKHYYKIVPKERRKEIEELRKKALKKGYVRNYETYRLHKDGRKIPVNLTISVIKDRDGKIIGTSGIFKDLSEKKKLEQEVKESKDYLQKIIEISPICIVTTDMEGKILSFNKGAEQVYGYKAREVLGRDISVLQPKDVPKELRREIYTTMLKREIWEGELNNVRKNGEIFPIYLRIKRILNDRGKPIGLISLALDITERKRAEEALRKSEEQFRLISENASDLIAMLNLEGKFLYASPSFQTQLGLDSEELLGTKFMDIIHPDDLPNVVEKIQKLVTTGTTCSSICRFSSQDRDWRIFDSMGTLVKQDNGKPSKIVVVARDVTEKKKLEDEIRKTKDYLQGIIEASADAIVTTSMDGRILSWNKGAEEIYGYAAEEVLGKPVLELYPPELKKERRQWVKKLLRGGIIRNKKTKIYNRDGKLLDINLSLSLFRDDKGNPISTVGASKNISREIKLAQKLKKYARQLEYSNKLKDLFTDIMRHDLLNPVGIIKNYTEIMLDEESDKEKIQRLRSMKKNAEKVINLIENASEYERLVGIEELDFEEADLNSIIKEAVHAFEPMLKAKKMEVEYKAEGECLAKVNPVIEDIFSNLISNAIKYSPENSKIVIGIEDDNDSWKVMVKDHGEGVPDEYKEAIFERFKRGGKKGVKGTGLGLAIVKRAVELHKGRVWVEDNPEGGSIFYVILPKVLSS